MTDHLSPSEQARLTCTCGHRLARHHERGCIDCGEPPTGFHAFQRQYHDQWSDAEYPPVRAEPRAEGLDVEHPDCGDRCACYVRGVDDEAEATRD